MHTAIYRVGGGWCGTVRPSQHPFVPSLRPWLDGATADSAPFRQRPGPSRHTSTLAIVWRLVEGTRCRRPGRGMGWRNLHALPGLKQRPAEMVGWVDVPNPRAFGGGAISEGRRAARLGFSRLLAKLLNGAIGPRTHIMRQPQTNKLSIRPPTKVESYWTGQFAWLMDRGGMDGPDPVVSDAGRLILDGPKYLSASTRHPPA